MLNISKAKVIGKDIFIYENFLSKEEIEYYQKEIYSIPDDDWIQSDWSLDPEYNSMWYSKRNSKVLELRDKISKLISGELFLGTADFFIKIKKGGTWGEHSDSYDHKYMIERSKQYVDGDSFYEQDVPIYGLIVYFNNFEGGQIYYTSQNIEYQPKAGDLIIHNADETCSHLVKEVKSDFRYSFSANIRKKIKVPLGGLDV